MLVMQPGQRAPVPLPKGAAVPMRCPLCGHETVIQGDGETTHGCLSCVFTRGRIVYLEPILEASRAN